MTLNETTVQRPPATLRQYFAAAAQALANRLAGSTVDAPSLSDVRDSQRYDAEIALLHAEAEEERQRFTVGMLRARVQRLKSGSIPAATEVPPRDYDAPPDAGRKAL